MDFLLYLQEENKWTAMKNSLEKYIFHFWKLQIVPEDENFEEL